MGDGLQMTMEGLRGWCALLMVILGIWKSASESWGWSTAEKAKSSSFSSSSEELSEPIYCGLPCLPPEGGGVDGCKRCVNKGLTSGWRVDKERGGSISASCFVYALVCARSPVGIGGCRRGGDRDRLGHEGSEQPVDNRLKRPSRKVMATNDTYLCDV